ncbi:hypothetical protein GQ53DRAFT_754411 [Thozetella sp. PMI_491]|nr:hypothetical protein GQ53DRAFT_754411 [Thozetella sp. PMI_491]
MPLIAGLHHVNLVVPEGTLDQANAFYGTTLGLTAREVPHLQRGTLAWFDIGSSGQQIHVAFGRSIDFEAAAAKSSRHPCFKIPSAEALKELQERVFKHLQDGGEGAPRECDQPGGENSGAKGVEYPTRFFARDYAGNRLEFTL